MTADNRRRMVQRSQLIAVVGILVSAAPAVLGGSLAWSAAVVFAGILVYYAGASAGITTAEYDAQRNREP